MNAERLQQVEELYHAALELEASQRADFLREVCSGDEALRHEVETLLAYDKRAENVFELPAMDLVARALAEDGVQPDPAFPAKIGRYRILRLLGEGGMGAVYEAEQEYPRRIVALKVIKPGLTNPELLRRFEQEWQALGRLQHPGIAQIYEAGTAIAGFGPQPWFAMELIRGESLLQYADAHQLKTRQRLELMAKVCEAVHHAHQRGIIHRDLKPGNILVDESSQPKVLDFGVARVAGSDAQATHQTDVGQIVGTLAYMSPEQVLGDPLELDTRSDVYSLGVILFELLAGRLPYKISGQLHEAAQTIREGDPAPLRSISRVYRGDIETIVAKALEKNKGRRYASAAGMAGDIRRYLDDEPIIARPPSTTYQLQKFARRHKALVAGAIAAVLLAVVSGLVTFQAATAPKQTVRLALLPFRSSPDTAQLAATLSRDTAVQLARLKGNSQVRFVFIPENDVVRKKVDSVEEARKVLSATHVLHLKFEHEHDNVMLHAYLTDARSGVNTKDWPMRYKAAQLRYAPVALTGLVTSSFRLPPLVTKATVNAAARQDYLTGLSYVQSNIQANERPDDAVTLLERAVTADPDSPLTYAGLAEAQWNKYFLARDVDSKKNAQESVRQAELRNPDLPEVHMISGLLEMNSGKPEQAEADFQRVIELQPGNGDAYRRLGMTYNSRGALSEALTALQKATQVRPDDFKNHRELGAFYDERSQYQEELAEFQKMVSLAPKRAYSHYLLGSALAELRRNAEAEGELRYAIGLQDLPEAEQTLAGVLMDAGKNREAADRYLLAIHIGPETALLWLDLGICFSREGREREARKAFRQGLPLAEKDLKENSQDRRARANLAYLAARLGDSHRAETEVAQALQVTPDDDTLSMAVFTYEALGRREQSLDLLAHSPSILTQLTWFPELADLRRDSRFIELLRSNHIQ